MRLLQTILWPLFQAWNAVVIGRTEAFWILARIFGGITYRGWNTLPQRYSKQSRCVCSIEICMVIEPGGQRWLSELSPEAASSCHPYALKTAGIMRFKTGGIKRDCRGCPWFDAYRQGKSSGLLERLKRVSLAHHEACLADPDRERAEVYRFHHEKWVAAMPHLPVLIDGAPAQPEPNSNAVHAEGAPGIQNTQAGPKNGEREGHNGEPAHSDQSVRRGEA